MCVCVVVRYVSRRFTNAHSESELRKSSRPGVSYLDAELLQGRGSFHTHVDVEARRAACRVTGDKQDA